MRRELFSTMWDIFCDQYGPVCLIFIIPSTITWVRHNWREPMRNFIGFLRSLGQEYLWGCVLVILYLLVQAHCFILNKTMSYYGSVLTQKDRENRKLIGIALPKYTPGDDAINLAHEIFRFIRQRTDDCRSKHEIWDHTATPCGTKTASLFQNKYRSRIRKMVEELNRNGIYDEAVFPGKTKDTTQVCDENYFIDCAQRLRTMGWASKNIP